MAFIELPDLFTLTEGDLDQLSREANDANNAVYQEKTRRRSLPFIYPQQVSMIGYYRAAIGQPQFVGEDDPVKWAKPANDLFAYIAGDRVEHAGEVFMATGPGAITSEPGTMNPITGAPDWRADVPEVTPESHIIDVQ